MRARNYLNLPPDSNSHNHLNLHPDSNSQNHLNLQPDSSSRNLNHLKLPSDSNSWKFDTTTNHRRTKDSFYRKHVDNVDDTSDVDRSELTDFDTLEFRLRRLNDKLDSVSEKTSGMLRRSHQLHSHSSKLRSQVWQLVNSSAIYAWNKLLCFDRSGIDAIKKFTPSSGIPSLGV
jgi:hypothetical protein